MSAAVRLGRIRGVEVIADISVFIVAGLLGLAQLLSLDATYDAGTIDTVLAIVVVFAYVGSLLLHEALHTIVAIGRGLDVRRIRLLVFGGYSLIDDRDAKPSDEFWVAMAGPVGSLAAGGLLWGLAWAMRWNEPTADTLRFLAIINVLIAAFNLLPGLPLDGGRALRAVLWNLNGDRLRSARMATVAGRMVGLGVAGLGVYLVVFPGDLTGFIWILLGWFLYRSATAAGKREELIALVAGSTARDVMRSTPDAVPGSMRVAEVTALYQIGPSLRTLPVQVGGRVTGIIGQAEIDELAPGRRELGRAASVMTPIGPGDIVDANTPVDALIGGTAAGGPRLVVVDDGVVVGVIVVADLETALD
jgi:Zn-dependent protease